MTIAVLPKYLSPLSDDAAAAARGEITPSRWNYGSEITMTGLRVIGRSSADAGLAEELGRTEILALLNLAKSDVGLGNVNNTSDVDKPISTATQAALDALATASIDTLPDTIAGLRKIAGINPAGDAVLGHQGLFHPQDYLGALTSDAALAACAADAIAIGGPVVITGGDWIIRAPFLVKSHCHLRTEGGGRLVPHPTEFVGNRLINIGEEGGLGGASGIAEFFSITGDGTLECNNDIDNCIVVVKGRFGRINVKEIHGANQKGILVGTAIDTYNSYQIYVTGVQVYYNDVANSPTSIGIHFNQATDCRALNNDVIGYRKGIQTENARIEMNYNHIWNRQVHGPLTHCIATFGSFNTLDQNYADSPTNYGDPSILTGYGFYNHGFSNIFGVNTVFMNADLKTDDFIICMHEDRDTYSDFGTLVIFTQNSNAYRFRKAISLFGGNTSWVSKVIQPGASYFSGSPAGLSGIHSVTGQNIVDYGTRNFASRSFHNGGLTSLADVIQSGATGVGRRYVWQSSGIDRVKIGLNSVDDFTADAYSNAAAFLFTFFTGTRLNGNFAVHRPVLPLSATAAALLDKTQPINTTGKVNGLIVWDSTNNRLMRSSGTLDTDTWWVIDGSASITPV